MKKKEKKHSLFTCWAIIMIGMTYPLFIISPLLNLVKFCCLKMGYEIELGVSFSEDGVRFLIGILLLLVSLIMFANGDSSTLKHKEITLLVLLGVGFCSILLLEAKVIMLFINHVINDIPILVTPFIEIAIYSVVGIPLFGYTSYKINRL